MGHYCTLIQWIFFNITNIDKFRGDPTGLSAEKQTMAVVCIKRTEQHVPIASTTTADPSHTPHTSTRPDPQQAPILSSTGADALVDTQQSPPMLTIPEAQQTDAESVTPDAHSLVSTAQVTPANGGEHTQAPSWHVPLPLQRLPRPDSEQNAHALQASSTLGDSTGQMVATWSAGTTVAFENLQFRTFLIFETYSFNHNLLNITDMYP